MIMRMVIMIITRLKLHDDVNDLVDELFNPEEVVNEPILMTQEEVVNEPIPRPQEEIVPEPIPRPQEEIVHEPIGQFALGVGIKSPMAPKPREIHLILGRPMPSTQYEFYRR